MIKKTCFFIFILSFFWACQEEDKTEKEIAELPVSFEVKRFDKEFAATTLENLPQIKQKYPYLFPQQFPDSLWISKINDTIQQELNREVEKEFPDFNAEEEEIYALFQHLKYYFEDFESPDVITITSEVDYKNKVIVADSLLLISLDTYLGEEHKFYEGMQAYLRKNFRPEQITPDIVTAYGKLLTPEPQSRTFLAHMIYYGKILYLKDKLIPQKTDAEKIGYKEAEMEWAKANEEQIWRYFIDKEILYNNDSELRERFINLAPFSKFGLHLDNDSPPQLGQYIGWQIVRQYMKKEEISLNELLKTDAETIFNKSNFKPQPNS